MYVESDFLLALIKDNDWLKESAEEIYRNNEELWTSRFTLIELLVVSYREDWNPVRIISNAARLVDIKQDTEDIKAAASYMEEEGFTPFDALHLVASGEEEIVSSDKDYQEHSETRKLGDDN